MIEVNRINLSELIELHTLCDKDFIPPLSDRVDIRSYCEKLVINAELITSPQHPASKAFLLYTAMTR